MSANSLINITSACIFFPAKVDCFVTPSTSETKLEIACGETDASNISWDTTAANLFIHGMIGRPKRCKPSLTCSICVGGVLALCYYQTDDPKPEKSIE